jgi:hypothetical protein
MAYAKQVISVPVHHCNPICAQSGRLGCETVCPMCHVCGGVEGVVKHMTEECEKRFSRRAVLDGSRVAAVFAPARAPACAAAFAVHDVEPLFELGRDLERVLAGPLDATADLLRRTLPAFKQAMARSEHRAPLHTRSFRHPKDLHALIRCADWSCGVIVVRNSDHKLVGPSTGGLPPNLAGHTIARVGIQTLHRAPNPSPLSLWTTTNCEVSAARFARDNLVAAASLSQLLAVGVRDGVYDVDVSDPEIAACFAEAVLAVLPVQSLATYTPEVVAPRAPGACALPAFDPIAGGKFSAVTPEMTAGFSAWDMTAVSLTDDGFGGAARSANPGISTAFTILSGLFARALMHAEDYNLGSANLLLSGASKIWYVVPRTAWRQLLALLAAKYSDTVPLIEARTAVKCLYPTLTAAEMAQLGAVRVVQRPGDLVVTQPGLTFHWTLSTGFSVAEATNMFDVIDGYGMEQAGTDLYEYLERVDDVLNLADRCAAASLDNAGEQASRRVDVRDEAARLRADVKVVRADVLERRLVHDILHAVWTKHLRSTARAAKRARVPS